MENLHPLKYISQTFQIPLSEVANELGIKRQSVNEWVGKKRKPIPEKHIGKIASLFNLDEKWFRKQTLLGSERLELQRIFVDRNATFEEYTDFVEDKDGNVYEIQKFYSPEQDLSRYLQDEQQANLLIEEVTTLINNEVGSDEGYYQELLSEVIKLTKTKEKYKLKMLKSLIEYLNYNDFEFGFSTLNDDVLIEKLDNLKSYYTTKK
ncbi:helix-turn-helix domain-containing protein [Sutcliffiella horikoshii]|uniref:helix-turn-helix domain-containing protein n=1 Tax=Sutcliffiella horikoshii TaxID=79883 RepID=UPI00385179B2